MKKLALLIFLLSTILPVRAQDEFMRAGVDVKRILHVSGVSVGEYLVTAGQTNPDGYTLFILHPGQGLVGKVNLLRSGLQIRGVATQGSELTIYVSSSLNAGVEVVERITFNRESAALSPATEVKSLYFPDKLVTGFTDGQDFCLVTAQSKPGTVTLERFTGRGAVGKKEFAVPDKALLKALLKKSFAFIPSGREIPLEQARSLHKVYWREGKLTFTFDGRKGSEDTPETTLLTLDPLAGTPVVQRIAAEKGSPAEQNSFLHADTLFVLGVDSKALKLSLFSLATLQPLKHFSYQSGEPIQLKSTPLLKNGENAERNWTEPEASRKVIKAIAAGTPVVSVWPKENAYLLFMGSHLIPRSGGGSMMMPSGGGSFSTPGGPVSMPVTYNPVYYGGGSSEAIYTYFGGALLKEQLLVAPAATLVENVHDRIRRRIEALSGGVKSGGLGTIAADGVVYVLYLDKKDKCLTVEEFK